MLWICFYLTQKTRAHIRHHIAQFRGQRESPRVYVNTFYPTRLPMRSELLGCRFQCNFERWNSQPQPPIWQIRSNLVIPSTNHAVFNRWTWENTPKQWAFMAIVDDKSLTVEAVLGGLLYFDSHCVSKDPTDLKLNLVQALQVICWKYPVWIAYICFEIRKKK